MISYVLRRILYAIPILIGVNVLIFSLFFVVNSPDDMARTILGNKNVTQAAIENWKQENGYHLPLFLNTEAAGIAQLTNTIFFAKSVRLFIFDFGNSDRTGTSIGDQIRLRMAPSLAIASLCARAGYPLFDFQKYPGYSLSRPSIYSSR